MTIALQKSWINFNESFKKKIFSQKTICEFVNGQILAWGLKNGAPSGQTATYRKTKVIQSYLRIWGTYDPIELSPPEPKKGGYMSVA